MLEELAERIEKLDGPDREVDGKIMCAIGSAQKRGNTLFRMHPEAGSTDVLVYTPTPFTASLDAAMTLYEAVPATIPSCPRKAAAAALRALAKEE